jgi:hypothetical protein
MGTRNQVPDGAAATDAARGDREPGGVNSPLRVARLSFFEGAGFGEGSDFNIGATHEVSPPIWR